MCYYKSAFRQDVIGGFCFIKPSQYSQNSFVGKAPDGFTQPPHILADEAKARKFIGSFALSSSNLQKETKTILVTLLGGYQIIENAHPAWLVNPKTGRRQNILIERREDAYNQDD